MSVPVGPTEHMVREFAPLSARKLDVRLYAQSTTESDWTVKLPPGARVVARRRRSSCRARSVASSSTRRAGPGGVHVKSTLTITRLRIPVSEYAGLRAWCEQVDRALSQRLSVAPKG